MRLNNLPITLALLAILAQSGCMYRSAPRESNANMNSNAAQLNNNKRPTINVNKPGGPRNKPTATPTP